MSDSEESSGNEGCSSPEVEQQTPSSFVCSSTNRRRLFSTEDGTSSAGGEENQQLQILQEIKASISSLSNRMNTIDTRLKSVEQHQKEALSSSCSSSVESAKKRVPAKVRVSSNETVWVLFILLCIV